MSPNWMIPEPSGRMTIQATQAVAGAARYPAKTGFKSLGISIPAMKRTVTTVPIISQKKPPVPQDAIAAWGQPMVEKPMLAMKGPAATGSR